MFNYSLVDGYLGCIQFSAIMSNTAMTICVQVSVWNDDFISLGYVPRGWIAGSSGYSV